MQGIYWMPCHHPLMTSDSCMQVVQDHMMCKVITGKGFKAEKIIEATITCEFIDPSIELSARQLSFQVEKVSLWIASWHLTAWLRGVCACVKAPL